MLNTLYNDNIAADDMEFNIACEQAILDIDKAYAAYSAIYEKASLDLRQAELECVKESGDMDRLTELYTEAAEKTGDKEQNIFKKIWEAIKGFFRRIGDFITGKSKKINDDDTKEVGTGITGFFKKGINKIETFFKTIGNGIKNLGIGKIIAAALLLSGLGLGISKIIKKTKAGENANFNDGNDPASDEENKTTEKVDGKTAKGWLAKVKNVLHIGNKAAESASQESGADKETTEATKGIITACGNLLKSMSGRLTSIFGKSVQSDDPDVDEIDDPEEYDDAAAEDDSSDDNKKNDKEDTKKESADLSDLFDDDIMFSESLDDDDDYDGFFDESVDETEDLSGLFEGFF